MISAGRKRYLRNIEYYENYREENKEQRREYKVEYRKVNRVRVFEYNTRYREENPEKYQARTVVNNAIRDGKLVRQNCWCGKIGQAHHEDYTQPLEVQWLCRKHHAELHRQY
jgi:hypothetical protein